MCEGHTSVFELCPAWCGGVTHVCVGVLSLGLGYWGVTVRAVMFTEVIGSLRVGGDQQLLDVSLWGRGKNKSTKLEMQQPTFLSQIQMTSLILLLLFFFLLLLLLVVESCVRSHEAVAYKQALLILREKIFEKYIKWKWIYNFFMQVMQALNTNRCKSANCYRIGTVLFFLSAQQCIINHK